MMLDYLVPGLFSTNALNSKYWKIIQYQEFESTNIMIKILTEILMFPVLSGGVSCSKGCCRRFGRIFGKCRLFEIIDNILTETLSMMKKSTC